ncbi:unnamed protein product [Miscanthus lutarioriparius]|uniref:Protein FAR1-RELATED SEQUENCE n=1 Tax=Miscanthus lutarioriparius TaxID=422564 RepID=A0A811QLU2_9POAL|nr:unnamed protein product [Miscanthus lutarioriparius]
MLRRGALRIDGQAAVAGGGVVEMEQADDGGQGWRAGVPLKLCFLWGDVLRSDEEPPLGRARAEVEDEDSAASTRRGGDGARLGPSCLKLGRDDCNGPIDTHPPRPRCLTGLLQGTGRLLCYVRYFSIEACIIVSFAVTKWKAHRICWARFNSFEEAKKFYNLYSWEIGFGIRISRGRKNDNDYITKKDICCSCEDHSPNPNAASCRTGCKAMIWLLRLKDHSWYISRSITEHNHNLSGSCGEKKQWNSHNQCQAMAAAIRTTMKDTRHRWCKWHVLRKAKQWIGNAYNKNGGFKKEFHRLVTEEVSAQKFERRWCQLIRKYKLEKNKFLKRIYKKRGMWARPYFMNVFCAGMTSTQRSESANHMLKQFIQRSAPMHLFVSKFNEFQCGDRNEQEDKEIHITKQMRRKRRIGVPIERHAEEIYTRAMYERFNNELYHSGSYSIRQRLGTHNYMVAHFKETEGPEQRAFIEHVGILCRHALKVLVHMEKTEIPAGNIMARWTKNATKEKNNGIEESGADYDNETTEYIRKQLLLKKVLTAAGVDGTITDGWLIEAMAALDRLTSLRTTVKGGAVANVGERIGSDEEALPSQCPPKANP